MLNLKRISLFIVLFLGITLGGLIAQPRPGEGDNQPDPEVPITGIEYLLAAGAGLGLKKIYDKRKKNNT
jgi:hypothetical protein